MDLMKLSMIILLMLATFAGFSQGEKGHIVKGNQLYKQKAFDQAANEYKKATEKNEKSAEAQFNLGNALYKSKKPFDAMQAFKGAYENSADKNVKSKAAYNQGVLLTRQQKLPECIEEYKGALRLNPGDVEARENLQKALNELKKQQQQQQNQNQNKNNNKDQDQDKNEDQQNENKSNLSKKRAEQMLNALRQEEKKIQQNLQNKNKAGRLQMKDW